MIGSVLLTLGLVAGDSIIGSLYFQYLCTKDSGVTIYKVFSPSKSGIYNPYISNESEAKRYLRKGFSYVKASRGRQFAFDGDGGVLVSFYEDNFEYISRESKKGRLAFNISYQEYYYYHERYGKLSQYRYYLYGGGWLDVIVDQYIGSVGKYCDEPKNYAEVMLENTFK